MTHATGHLAEERVRSALEQAARERRARWLRALRRAARKERAAERRLIQAWSQGAELRARLGSADR